MNLPLRRPPFAFAKRHGVLLAEPPADAPENAAPILYVRPATAFDAIAEMRRFAGQTVKIETLPDEDFDRTLARLYEGQAGQTMLADDLSEERVDAADLSAALADAQDLLESDDDAPVIRFINGLLIEAIRENASDIHVETFENRLSVRFRVDGVLRQVIEAQKALAPKIVSRIKIMARLDIAEKRLPQDGRISRAFGGRKVDVRVSTTPTGVGNERVVMRILDKQAGRLDLDVLGMPAEQIEILKRVIGRPHGILLVTGPTGSGKSTTLYAALSTLNDKSRNILTVEDPIEYYIDGVGQTQVNSKVDMTFARGLRAILRQDPDVVMIGEIRDLETAKIAVQASQTGHLVLSTLHTNTAVGAVARLRDMGLEPYQLSSSLVGLMAQRLIRLLCPECKTPRASTRAERRQLGLAEDNAVTVYDAVGCAQCRHTGYQGRTAIHEIIEVDRALEDMIHDNTPEPRLEAQARTRSPGIFQIGRARVLAGDTTLSEVLRVTVEE